MNNHKHIFQGSSGVGKEDIEKVFALYDRVSKLTFAYYYLVSLCNHPNTTNVYTFENNACNRELTFRSTSKRNTHEHRHS